MNLEALDAKGFTPHIVCVVPPGASLTPSSRIPPTAIGKVPGIRMPNGLWRGYDWRTHQPTLTEVEEWIRGGASLGLRAGMWPGLDIDCSDLGLAAAIADFARNTLGPSPIRTGRPPKRLLVYRTSTPFGRIRLWIKASTKTHLVELLGEGQQYLIEGIHPGTLSPYTWDVPLEDADLVAIDRAKACVFLEELAAYLALLGVGEVTREGTGELRDRGLAPAQAGLLAPSGEALRAAVALIPNSSERYPDRESYIKMGYAIKAAAGDDEDVGFEVFSDWAARWDGGVNEPEVVRGDWRKMRGEKSVGWPLLAETARGYGFADAALDFEPIGIDQAVSVSAPEDNVLAAPHLSDQWLTDEVVSAQRHVLRYVPERGRFLAWNGHRWQPDSILSAEDLIHKTLRVLAAGQANRGVTPKEQREASDEARAICSAAKAGSVATLLKANRAMAVSQTALDADPWSLNTPGGLVNLRTGWLVPAAPDALATKSTAVAPSDAPAVHYMRFLDEVCRGDLEMVCYLQRLCGYSLTGTTTEQHLTFVYGGGGNGKGLWLKTLGEILGDYATAAPMETFTANPGERHTTELAMLAGARVVMASETEAGHRWNESRLKALTGGDPVTARFMRMDNFTYEPQFKLIFIGNHRPELRTVDDAMRRRIHLVPFKYKPPVVDRGLLDKLRAEYPAILGWMIEGCLAWQAEGLNPPESVRVATEEYFAAEDTTGSWLEEMTDRTDPDASAGAAELFSSWRVWSARNNVYTGSAKRFGAELATRGLHRIREGGSGRRAYRGIRVTHQSASTDDLGVM